MMEKRRISLLALGGLCLDEQVAPWVNVTGYVIGSKIQWVVDICGIYKQGEVIVDGVDLWDAPHQLADSNGKQRRFSELGAALIKVRRAIGRQAITLDQFEVVGERVPSMPSDLDASAAARADALVKMLQNAQASIDAANRNIAAMQAYGSGVIYEDRHSELAARIDSLSRDVAEIESQQNKLPAISAKPDS